MKKYFLTGALITITATTLYATTAGSTVVDKMKAAAHSFTLATSLNPTDTGLTSAPLVGKKTGDVLTAGEYNRLLEMIAQGSVGGSSSWVDVPLTDTSDFDDNCDYRVKLSSVGNLPGGNKDDWIYSPDRIGKKVINWSNSIVIQSATKNVLWWQWSSNDTYANVSAAWGLNITKIEKLCGGGGTGGAAATCPSGFVAVGSFCIEPTMNATNKDWYEAALACTEKGAQLCHWSEWSAACQKGVLTDVVFGTGGKYEWIDDYSIANQGIADPIVYSNCKYLSRQADGTKAANTSYRCCAPKQ